MQGARAELKDPSIGSLSQEAWGLGSSVRGALPLWKGDSPWSEVFRLRGLVTGLLVAGPKWPPLSLCVNRTRAPVLTGSCDGGWGAHDDT